LVEVIETFLLISSIVIIGFLLNVIAARLLVGRGRIARLKIIALLKGAINIFFIISWASFLFMSPLLSIPLFFITGFLLIILTYLLFNVVHDQLYIKRGAEFLTISLPMIVFLQEASQVISQYKDIIANAYAIGLGFMLGINLLTAFYAYQLYNEMKGGAAIWLLIAVYAGSIFVVSLMGVLATFYNVYGLLTDIESFILNMSPMIVPDIVMLYIGIYYKNRVLPIIQKLVEETTTA